MPDLRALRETIARLRLMDRLSLLGNHLDRAYSTIEVFSFARENENTRVALLRFQIRLDNYYHFLARLSPEQDQCFSQLEWMRDNLADAPGVLESKKQIELEFSHSRAQFINQIRDLEGPSLLSWIHTIRYYISRTKEKAEDLQRWTEARAYLSESRKTLNDLSPGLAGGWPALTSQTQMAFSRLESEVAKPWSFGSGRRVSHISNRLEKSLNVLKALATEASELQMAITTLIEKLPPETDPDALALILEIKKLNSSLNPRHRSLLREVSEVSRKLEVKGRLESIKERELASIFSPTDYTDWVEHLSKGHENVAGVHRLADSVMKVLPSMTPLLQSLRNEEQQQELISRRESLVRTLIEANLAQGEEPYSALVYLNWLAIRLNAKPGKKGICTRFGETILPDDSTLQCQDCGQHCHEECLDKGRCPVDGYVFSPSDFDLHYSEMR